MHSCFVEIDMGKRYSKSYDICIRLHYIHRKAFLQKLSYDLFLETTKFEATRTTSTITSVPYVFIIRHTALQVFKDMYVALMVINLK